jgi:hypothetical protein
MTTDITIQFQKAAARASAWTHNDVSKTVAAVAKRHPGARVDWEPGDEEWARVLDPGGHGLIALICARIPLGFIRGTAPWDESLEDVVWLSVSSTADVLYKVDPEVLDQTFGRTVSRNLNYDSVSADDIWWATV